MRCMTNFARHTRPRRARQRRRPRPLGGPQERRHHPLRQLQPLCLRPSVHLLDEAPGYLAARCWRAGENIAWGTGELRRRPLDLRRLAALARAPRQPARPLLADRHRALGRQPRRPPQRPRLDPGLRLPLRRRPEAPPPRPAAHRPPHRLQRPLGAGLGGLARRDSRGAVKRGTLTVTSASSMAASAWSGSARIDGVFARQLTALWGGTCAGKSSMRPARPPRESSLTPGES